MAMVRLSLWGILSGYQEFDRERAKRFLHTDSNPHPVAGGAQAGAGNPAQTC